MPSLLKNETMWNEALSVAKEAGADDVLAMAEYLYQQGVGESGESVLLSQADLDRARETISSQGLGQLMRAGTKKESAIPGSEDPNYLFTPLREAEIDDANRTANIIAITEGPGNTRDKNYYSRPSIESFVPLLDGVRCFINHSTRGERIDRPEGDLWVQCGYFKNSILTERGGLAACLSTLVFDEGAAGKEGLAKAKTSVRYAADCPLSNEVYAGFSVNGGGRTKGKVNVSGIEYNNVIVFTDAESVDMVTRPARGGIVLAA